MRARALLFIKEAVIVIVSFVKRSIDMKFDFNYNFDIVTQVSNYLSVYQLCITQRY